MSQFGGGRLGGVPLVAGGTVPQDMRALPHGPIRTLYLNIAFKLISTAAAFNTAISTGASAAAEGSDDADTLLDALFSLVTWFADEDHMVGALKFSQWRTILGLLNQRDLEGTFLNGVSIPISSGSAKQFNIVIPFPVSLDRYFKDGAIFANGSRRLSTGRFEYTCGASLTPTVVLLGGSAVVSGLSVSITPETGAGTEDDVGMLWRVNRKASLPTVYAFDDQLRIALLDVQTVAANPVTNYNIGDYSMWTPSDFGAKYQGERLYAGGYDVTARVTPLLWVEPDRSLLDFNAHLGKTIQVDAVSGAASLTLYDVQGIPAPASAVEKVSQHAGAGGPVRVDTVAPRSLPPGIAVPPHLAGLLPVRISPANTGIAGPSKNVTSPAGAAQKTMQKTAATKRVGSFMSAFRRK